MPNDSPNNKLKCFVITQNKLLDNILIFVTLFYKTKNNNIKLLQNNFN